MFPLVGVTVIFSTAFQALGKAHYSLIVSIVRQLLVLLPVAYLFSTFNNVNLIWYSFIISEIIGIILVSFLFKKTYKNSVGNWIE